MRVKRVIGKMSPAEAGRLGYLKARHVLQALTRLKTKRAKERYKQCIKYCKHCRKQIPYEKRLDSFCS